MAPVSHDLSTERKIRETDKDTHVVVLITATAARVPLLSKKKEKLSKQACKVLILIISGCHVSARIVVTLKYRNNNLNP